MRSLAPSIVNQAAGVGGNAETSVRTRTDRPVWLLTVKTAADRPAASRTMALVVVVIENAESMSGHDRDDREVRRARTRRRLLSAHRETPFRPVARAGVAPVAKTSSYVA